MRAPSACIRGAPLPSSILLAPVAKASRTSFSRRLASSSSSTPTADLVNPIASSRPAPLDLPERQPSQSKFSHLLAQAKTYIKFYKGGLSAVFANRREIQAVIASKSAASSDFRPPSVFRPGLVPAGFTRADWVLLWRVRHDILRVPLFGLVLLVCGEFTPLIVIFVDGVVPYTCRLPRQLDSSFTQAEERRRAAFADFERAAPQGVAAASPPPGAVASAARKHVLRSLHLPGMMWDKIGFVPPGMWATKGRLRLAFLEGDDQLLLRDGGAAALEGQEARIACAERGIDCAGRTDDELRRLLDRWLELTDARTSGERRKRLTVLLTTRTEKWPENRDFPLPEWHL
ncbi:hypothetical protein Cob_v000259 [Colletotrichum orbiculare MAFF 240422]|uniref:Letm1 RBD domain-containing protein n=1 Tax=Colletotrichum orbiculare (strain 104-T / ATCC 96160 / CBS 514.97 / LARS 414 / MAFF 240422) TaxID=1213857 RepID=A0A484G9K5_COLOR|nr:hypothetical protein Cob_v000259 [Colletotrichum orbiculare MAFF 240422]